MLCNWQEADGRTATATTFRLDSRRIRCQQSLFWHGIDSFTEGKRKKHHSFRLVEPTIYRHSSHVPCMRSCETSQSRPTELKELKSRLLERCVGKKRTVHPYAESLIDMEWAVFGGLSWANEFCRTDSRAAQRIRFQDFRSLYKIAYQPLSIRFFSILFYFRSEPSPAGEWHSHFLIAAKGIEPVRPDVLASTLQNLWTEKFKRGFPRLNRLTRNANWMGFAMFARFAVMNPRTRLTPRTSFQRHFKLWSSMTIL